MRTFSSRYDVVVVGGGNAGLSAAIAAIDSGASVLIVERDTAEARGGNSRFTAGAVRFAFEGVDDLRPLIPDVSGEELSRINFGSYPREAFFDDLARVTKYRANPDLADLVVSESLSAMVFWAERGVRFVPAFRRQAFEIEGKFTFWGGIALETVGGGPGLVESLYNYFESAGGDVTYGTRAVSLIMKSGRAAGIEVIHEGVRSGVDAAKVVMAAGGFQADAAWRARYLGAGWDLARVRGTWANTGDGIRMALEAGASPAGHWSGAHAVPWDLNAPEFGDLRIGDQFSKLSYPFGIMLNARGERFLDEGADFRNYTYAKYGREIITQPDQFAWQVFDAKTEHLLRDEYHIQEASRVRANSLDQLVGRLDGVDPDASLRTIRDFNDSIDMDTGFNPNIKDGKSTRGLPVSKSNWALAIEEPPFSAYAVTCGVTFTFGGVRIDPTARVLSQNGTAIPGLYAAGEMVGGLFYHNYPGGSGLTAGTVFGRIAGSTATE